jgi:hypothetical protein
MGFFLGFERSGMQLPCEDGMIGRMADGGADRGDRPAFRVEARKVRVWRRGGHIVIAILALTVALLVLELPAPLALLVGIGLELWRRAVAALSARPRQAVIRDGDHGRDEVLVERDGRTTYLRRDEISDCWQLTHPETGAIDVFALTAHALVAIQVFDSETAEALVRALGGDATSRIVSTTLSGAPTVPDLNWRHAIWIQGREMGIVLGSLAAMMLVLVFPIVRNPIAIVILVFFFSVVVPGMRTLAAVRARSRVFVGRDGLLLTTPEQRRFIGFEQVKGVSDALHAVSLKLESGEELALPLAIAKGGLWFGKPHPLDAWFRDVDHVLARRRRLAQQIKDALARFRAAGADSDAEATARLLDRGDRPFVDWYRELGEERASSYRERQLDSDQLVNTLENPRIPLGQRLGAALALAQRGDRDQTGVHRSRLHAVVGSSANPRVRIALELAESGKLGEAEYEQALAAEAEAERAARKTRSAKA